MRLSPIVRLVLVGLAHGLAHGLAVGGAASAQVVAPEGVRPFATLDVMGSPYASQGEGAAIGGSVGARVGSGVALALHVEHADDRGGTTYGPGFRTPGWTLLGLDAHAVRGPARAPWQASVAVGVRVVGRRDLVLPEGGDPHFARGAGVGELRGRVQVLRAARVADGGVRAFVGGGVFVERYYETPSTMLFAAGGPRERAFPEGDVWGASIGVVLVAPVAVRLGGGRQLSLVPTLRAHPLIGLHWGKEAIHVAARLDL